MSTKTVFDQYNMAIMRIKDLQDQLRVKDDQIHELEVSKQTTEKIAKDLCSKILAKNREEMKLGKEYSWEGEEINELLRRSSVWLTEHEERQLALLNKLLADTEERRKKIDNLEEEIEQLLTQPGARHMTREELQERIEKEKAEEAGEAAVSQVYRDHNTTPHKFVSAEDANDLLTQSEMENIKKTADINAKMMPMQNSHPHFPSRQKKDFIEKSKKEAKAYMVNLQEYEEKFGEIGWEMLKIIGTKGLSTYRDIEQTLLEGNKSYSERRCRSTVENLCNNNVLFKENVKSPLRGSFPVYCMTPMGKVIYENQFQTPPVEAEAELLAAEHDNLEHGYGIHDVADILRSTQRFSEVKEFNRKEPIQLQNGAMYIPDIVCVDKDKNISYIEYECGYTTQHDFNAKCSKMVRVTSAINFIVPNKQIIEKLRTQVKGWIKTRGKDNMGKNVVRIATAKAAPDLLMNDNRSWNVVYSKRNNFEGEENF